MTAPTRASVLELRDAFVAAGRALFDALDVYAFAADLPEHERTSVNVALAGEYAGRVESDGYDVRGLSHWIAPGLALVVTA